MMLPEATFVQVTDADSDGSIENMIADCQTQYMPTMKEWETIYPIEPLGSVSPPFWKDIPGKHLVIPLNDSLKRQIMQVWHDNPTARHLG